MFLESRFERALDRICGKAAIPVRLELWNGRRFDLSPDPTVTITIPGPSVLRYFLSPNLNCLGEAFVEGHIIDRYVFPDGELPHLSLVLKEMADAGLEVVDVESLRRHYARTCREWADRLESNRHRAARVAGDKRVRIWQIYLAGCAYGFAQGWMNVYQVLACHAQHPDANPLPLTRGYMYGRPETPPEDTGR